MRPLVIPEEREGGGTTPQDLDRSIRALVSLADELSVEREAHGLLATCLERVVSALGVAGGLTLVLDAEGELGPAAEHGTAPLDMAAAMDLARAAVSRAAPMVRVLGGGWLAAAPLVSKRCVLGVVALHDQVPGRPPEGGLLEAIGKLIGTGLDNARLYAELSETTTRLEFLNRISAALTTSMDLKTVVPAFAKEIKALQDFDRLACGFVNESGDYIEVTGYPEDAGWGLGSVLPVVGSGAGLVVLNNEAILQTDLLHAHRYIEDMRLLEEGIRSYVILPLNSRGRGIGVLCLGSRSAASYDETTVAHVQPLADSVALAFENVRLFQRTRELSITDEVTPLYNFRFFHQILERELKLVDRYKSMLSLIFVDLDRFKPINDQWGHLRGSRVLREVGFLLRAAVRDTDYPARYGGDEFVVILPQTDGQSARFLAEKLRSMIEEHTFLQEEGINARIGVSLGIATYPTEARSKESLIRLADERMYGDKDERRPER
ncbi:MAG TPA: sensor domain-containing diguanylate cyclase [Vicinamibacteria bacterium]|nr:sensor domain-containing diguanylate cyclase [Vicinamibacteria bacterium]